MRASDSSARALAACVQSQCLSVGLERGAHDPGGGVVDEDVERAELGHLGEHALGADVAAHEPRLGAQRLAAPRPSPRRRVSLRM